MYIWKNAFTYSMKNNQAKKNLIIGVLGGIGPEATGEFYTKLFKKLREVGTIKENSDFPQIVINSIPAPELIHEEIIKEELSHYMDGIIQLDKFGVDIIVMVCNTIHIYYDKLQQIVGTPIIDLRNELRRKLEFDNIQRISIIGTPNTIRQGLYKFQGIDTINPTADEINELSNAIYNFNINNNQNQQRKRIEKIVQKYVSSGAERVVLGCTEFAVMLKDTDLPIVNTIDILVDCVVRRIGILKEVYE